MLGQHLRHEKVVPLSAPDVEVRKELMAAGREPLAANKAAAEQRGVIVPRSPCVHVLNPCDDLVRHLSRKARAWPLDPVPSNPVLSVSGLQHRHLLDGRGCNLPALACTGADRAVTLSKSIPPAFLLTVPACRQQVRHGRRHSRPPARRRLFPPSSHVARACVPSSKSMAGNSDILPHKT